MFYPYIVKRYTYIICIVVLCVKVNFLYSYKNVFLYRGCFMPYVKGTTQ